MLYDKDIREPLFDFLEMTYHKTRIIEEKQIGRSRADVFMITEDAFFGIEIKSDADSYVRLAGQVQDYDRYYDYNYAAVGSSHAAHIEEHLPDHWGIITIDEVDGKPDFYILRRPKANPNLQLARKLSLLWRPELAKLLQMNSLPEYKLKSKPFVIERITSKVPDKVPYPLLCVQMSQILFERDYTTIADEINRFRTEVEKLPPKKSRRKRRRKPAPDGPALLVSKIIRKSKKRRTR